MKKRIHVIRTEEQMQRLLRYLDEMCLDSEKRVTITIEDFSIRPSQNLLKTRQLLAND